VDETGGVARTRRRTRYLIAALGILSLGWLILRVAGRSPERPPLAPLIGSVVFADVAGWYRRTPDEVAVVTPFDLSIDQLPDGLPMRFGPWRGKDRRHDPAVDVWFRQPDVAIERTYERADGEIVWLSLFGSRGDKSFHLFEHTPDTCYPLGGWRIDRTALAHLPLGRRPLALNHGVATGPAGGLVFFWVYLWDTPARDAARGVLSLRIAAPVSRTPEATYAVLAQDFLPRLFPRTLAWTRF